MTLYSLAPLTIAHRNPSYAVSAFPGVLLERAWLANTSSYKSQVCQWQTSPHPKVQASRHILSSLVGGRRGRNRDVPLKWAEKEKLHTQFTANHYGPIQETNPLETQQVAGSNGLSIHKNKKKSRREERKYIFHKCCPIPDYEPIKVSP